MDRIVGNLNKNNNPEWPPIIGSLVVIQRTYGDKIYAGRIYKNVRGSIVSLVLLLNDLDYVDENITANGFLPNTASSRGFMILTPSIAWSYIDTEKLDTILSHNTQDLKSKMLDRYQNIITGPLTQHDLSHENLRREKPVKEKACGIEDDFKDESLLNEKRELQLNNLFKEMSTNVSLYNPKESFKAPSQEVKKLLLKKLREPEPVSEADMKIIVNKSIAIRNMIETKEDEINEGRKIVSWIMDNMVKVKTDGINIFGDLKMLIFNGYVHIARKGIKTEDIITEQLVPDLERYSWQYGIPIDYDTLKYILFQNSIQRGLNSSIEEQKEAERILSQEYLITLQPEPKYQIWCLKRLIMAWYADVDLQNNIRKIKVLINQWRARDDIDFNKRYGVQPSIVIYPKYGKTSARIVLSKLSDYFLLYQNIGWKCSRPSYFVKVNRLIWYTNGSIDLKMYFRKVKKGYNGTVTTKSFEERYTRVNGAERLLYPYADKNTDKS